CSGRAKSRPAGVAPPSRATRGHRPRFPLSQTVVPGVGLEPRPPRCDHRPKEFLVSPLPTRCAVNALTQPRSPSRFGLGSLRMTPPQIVGRKSISELFEVHEYPKYTDLSRLASALLRPLYSRLVPATS